jgi:nitrilase
MRVGAAQLRPVWLNRTATIAKVVSALETAKSLGIELLAFPEAFVSGYPFWLCRTNGAAWDDDTQKLAYAQFLESCVEVPSDDVALVIEAARDLGVSLYLGINERGRTAGRGSIYCSLLSISRERGLLGTHRKLVPTYDERLCWAQGDGQGLTVHRFGELLVGGLNCWENWMPVARFALYAGGEDVHVSVWPGNPSVSRDATRLIALEGRVWSINASGILSFNDVPREFAFYDQLEADGLDEIFKGGTTIISPAGEVVAEAQDGAEDIIWFDVDAQSVRGQRQNFDPTGHYFRPDVFHVTIDRSRRVAIHERDDSRDPTK